MIALLKDRKFSGAAPRTFTVLTLAFVCAGLAPAHLAPALGQTMRMDAIATAKSDLALQPFGRVTSFAPAGPLWIKWRSLDDSFARDETIIAQCRAERTACSPAAARLAALIDEARTLSGRHRLAIVNREINLSIAYTSDALQFGVADVWSGPVATLASGRGDCEDYAIAKMFALRAAGVPAQDMRLLVARLRTGGSHAVLAVREDGHWLLLDNRSMALGEDSRTADLTPLFALDAGGAYRFGDPARV